MAKKQKKRDAEFQRLVNLLCGQMNEDYYMERYVGFWNFISLLCFPDDEISRDQVEVCSIANIVVSLAEDRLPRFSADVDAMQVLTAQKFTAEMSARAILDLANDHDSLSERLIHLVTAMEYSSAISEALLRLGTVQHKDPRRSASLAKAFHFVLAGGIDKVGDVSIGTELKSEASLKGYWKSWCDSFAFVHAFNSIGVDFIPWSPFLDDGPTRFSRDLRKRPDLFIEFFGTAKSIQMKIISLLDETARKRPFLKFPDEIAALDWRAEPLDKRQLEIARTYKSKR